MQSQKRVVPKDETEKHLDMMRHAERWPKVILPLKHKERTEPDGAAGLLGFMLQDPRTQVAFPKVYIGCIFYHYMGKEFKDLPVEEYADLEAVVAAGWEVN